MSEELENNSAVAQPETATTESVSAENRDKLTAQLDAYKRCFAALQSELAEIEQQYGADSESASDPLKELAGEVSGFKSEMAELRKMIENLRNAPAVTSQQAPQIPQQQAPQYYYQQPQPPMVTAATLPYLQTPSFTPLMPAMPTFNR